MKSALPLLVLILSLLGGCDGFGQRISAANRNRIDQDVRTAMNRFHVPGAAVMVIADGQLLLVQAYGERELQHRLPVKTDTLFEIGSITKQFTAACILQLRSGQAQT